MSHCRDEDHHHGHGHDHGGHGHSHGSSTDHEKVEASGDSLYGAICLDQVESMNASDGENMGRNVIRPYDERELGQGLSRERVAELEMRLGKKISLISDEGPELILKIPFDGDVKVSHVCIIGGVEGNATVKLFKNKQVTWDNVKDEKFADMELDYQQDNVAGKDIPLAGFNNVQWLTLYFGATTIGPDGLLRYITDDDDEDETLPTTFLTYVGFKGRKKGEIIKRVEATYEARAQMKDHQSTRADRAVRDQGF